MRTESTLPIKSQVLKQNEVIACPEVVTEPEHFVACYQTNQMAKVMGLSGHFPFTFDDKTFIGSGEGSAPGPLAFVAGDDSLETLLRVNKDRYDAVKDQQFTEAEAGSAVLSSAPNNFTFVVFKSSAVFKSSSAVSMFGSEQPVVPTFSFFAEFVKSSSGFEIPLDLTRDLVAAKLTSSLASKGKDAAGDGELGWKGAYVRFGNTEPGLLNLVKGRGKWSPSGATAAAAFGGFGREVRSTLREAANQLSNKLSHAQHLDEVTWTTKNWHGLQMQRLSVVLHTAVAWQTVNELACGESGIVHGAECIAVLNGVA
ncbi:hypothetical protein EMIHUDRAFT_233381 [Emiliania huxleyi CCMP1516]|uniref:Uncharacterized protein n=2 Tax=Emiliania huxleyi TaxID=2903 RepID=A0A0D3K244_EMIH1|nr:hypothetical protein EMIHUDRAFT_233381 [Emiliania huxleyi CCMP1516]EOD29829.1 hypothetical protein EMIHUDRAFT_233381 [Emiliania huxleyi CCMP1516]|eukprot:XP_005782258.1 hypothetical protein EMIHUDRAFT_233381 [Emiliania huxleyi CCMP1516]